MRNQLSSQKLSNIQTGSLAVGPFSTLRDFYEPCPSRSLSLIRLTVHKMQADGQRGKVSEIIRKSYSLSFSLFPIHIHIRCICILLALAAFQFYWHKVKMKMQALFTEL